jgi:hypothetical protein
VTRTTTTWLNAEQSPNLNRRKRKRLSLKLKLDPRKKSFAFLFEEINALKNKVKPEKTASKNKRKTESLLFLSTESNLTTSSDEGEQQEYLFNSSKPFSSSKTKLAKSSHPTIKH